MYERAFFTQRLLRTQISAEVVVPKINTLFKPNSVIDFGCANCVWLAEFLKYGIDDILGVDGFMIDNELLLVPDKYFKYHDLETLYKTNKTFDIAISLEVAEHISPDKSDLFIDSLTNASKTIIFSAAIPHQGGHNQVNEQWPDYWAEKFYQRGYLPYDLIRNKIWENKSVATSYRQNIICFIHYSINAEIFIDNQISYPLDTQYLSVVHPGIYMMQVSKISQLERKLEKFKLIVKLNDFFSNIINR